MLKKLLCLIFLTQIITPTFTKAQDISIFTQINGRYDFTFIGNTMNPYENNFMFPDYLLTQSSANLNLSSNDRIERAYLYWAGSGSGDTLVKLNGTDMTPDILNTIQGTSSSLDYFSAFKDITTFVQNNGNGTYTLSDFDLNSLVTTYYLNATQFAGWAILVVYENPNLTLNQINIYQGLEALSPNPYASPPIIDNMTIELNNLYLISNTGAKIGFIAWEGDRMIQESERLSFSANGVTTILSNSLNPSNNAFNGTNTEINETNLYNMDLDVYSIENYIVPGTTSATVSLQSAQDYVMLSTIVTKLNSQLPDATIVLENPSSECNSRELTLAFTVSNINSTEVLQANTPITFYVGSEVLATTYTQNVIPIGGSEYGTINLTIPNTIPLNFTLKAVVDDTGSGIGIRPELIENNNTFEIEITLIVSPSFNTLENLTTCNLGLNSGVFDFSSYSELVKTNGNHVVSFHESYDDALQNNNPILNTNNFQTTNSPKEIFVRIDNGCISVTSFLLLTKNCPPTVYNAVSPNNDGANDSFFIDGLRDVFLNFELFIYNRWGRLLWTGNNTKPDWDGYVEDGILSNKAPSGTYFYILQLNDSDYPEPLTGYLYLLR
ncbi:gliding motility-associated C-terminal domain-containing protein [Flavobacterium sp. HXWNR69]|uniref:Gliding motility-associated C-terminal domain-containing protein n=1 Tax=Flavobacterium fragile TaxID=2949085 RepID=A0ABT0TG66_9FLAO|nr:gliding motility-associated C-terminal domain-containing protein [Flavobacterium sp. HXWNR69]MCL9769887.1 gliding motility-associated C-terminal domain-containing protein [Flavobacterium sp. HXWNR69]